MTKNNLHIVFFHELGHYVAHNLNRKLTGIGAVESIILKRHEIEPNNFDYTGETKPLNKTNREILLVNLVEKLCVIIYGCYFQLLFTKERDIKSCFCYENKKARGYKDCYNMIAALQRFDVNGEEKAIFYDYILKEYFEKIKKEKEINQFFNIVPENYLSNIQDDIVNVELSKLDNDISDAIENHKTTYSDFFYKISEILKPYIDKFKE
jgi:hypothetical protein